MPSSIEAFYIDLEALHKVFGCKDEAMLKAIIKKEKLPKNDTDPDDYEGEELDDEDDDDEEEIDEIPSSQEALRHIIMGEPYFKGIPSKYGYLFLSICRYLGERVLSSAWEQTRADYVSNFDKVLAKLKIPASTLRMESFIFGEAEFPLPKRSDVPTICTFTQAQSAVAAEALGAVSEVDLASASKHLTTRRGEVEPEFVTECVLELKAWFEGSVRKKKDIITFYY